MSHLLLNTDDPTTLREALPSFTKTTHIFLPINDSHSRTSPESGSHWSLLVVSIADRISFHYDSLNSANKREGETVSRKLGLLLGLRLEFKDLDDSPQQVNSTDCGIFTCLTMRHLLLNRLLKKQRGEKVSMSMGEREVDAAKGRKELLKLLETQRREAEGRRRRSEWVSSSFLCCCYIRYP